MTNVEKFTQTLEKLREVCELDEDADVSYIIEIAYLRIRAIDDPPLERAQFWPEAKRILGWTRSQKGMRAEVLRILREHVAPKTPIEPIPTPVPSGWTRERALAVVRAGHVLGRDHVRHGWVVVMSGAPEDSHPGRPQFADRELGDHLNALAYDEGLIAPRADGETWQVVGET